MCNTMWQVQKCKIATAISARYINERALNLSFFQFQNWFPASREKKKEKISSYNYKKASMLNEINEWIKQKINSAKIKEIKSKVKMQNKN